MLWFLSECHKWHICFLKGLRKAKYTTYHIWPEKQVFFSLSVMTGSIGSLPILIKCKRNRHAKVNLKLSFHKSHFLVYFFEPLFLSILIRAFQNLGFWNHFHFCFHKFPGHNKSCNKLSSEIVWTVTFLEQNMRALTEFFNNYKKTFLLENGRSTFAAFVLI